MEYDPKRDSSWESYILQFFEYCDLDRDGREDIINTGWCFGYRWTQIALNEGKNRYGKWISVPGQIRYVKQTAGETIMATFDEGCCGYAPDVMALVSFTRKDKSARFKYHAYVESLPLLTDSFTITYTRPFTVRQAITLMSYLPDSTEIAGYRVDSTDPEESCDLGCYYPGARGIALQETMNEGQLWYLVLMPPGPGLREMAHTFPLYYFHRQQCYYAVGWVEG